MSTIPRLAIAITAIAVLMISSFPRVHPAERQVQTRGKDAADLKSIEEGRVAFYEFACWRCHTLENAELPGNQDFENLGPDLSEVGDRLSEALIRQSIIDPTAVIAEPKVDHTNEFGASKMPAFGDVLPARTLRNITRFLSRNKARSTAKSPTIAVTEKTFQREVLNAPTLVLLDFWAEWCIPCLELNPILEQLAKEFEGRVKICKIDVDENAALVVRYVPDNIFPCLILMKAGKVLDRQYGADPNMEIAPFFRKWFQEHLIERD